MPEISVGSPGPIQYVDHSKDGQGPQQAAALARFMANASLGVHHSADAVPQGDGNTSDQTYGSVH